MSVKDLFDLTGKVALVTGGSRGLGLEMAAALGEAVASVAGMIGLDPDVLDAVGYSASKGAIIMLTRDLAVKWAPHGIRVNAIAPGFFDTRLSHALLQKTQQKIEKTTPMGRIGQPGEL